MGCRMFSTTDSDTDGMVQFKIVDESDKEYSVEAEVGDNMMQAGLKASVPFQVACGGNAECCTCHCFFPKEVM